MEVVALLLAREILQLRGEIGRTRGAFDPPHAVDGDHIPLRRCRLIAGMEMADIAEQLREGGEVGESAGVECARRLGSRHHFLAGDDRYVVDQRFTVAEEQ